MNRLLAAVVFLSASPVFAIAKEAKAAPADKCAPIGKLADGTLVYDMRCDNFPPVVANKPAEQVPAIRRTGIFGMSYTSAPPTE